MLSFNAQNKSSSQSFKQHLHHVRKRSFIKLFRISAATNIQICKIDRNIEMDVSKNRGTPKWMVKIMENPMNKWMIWGVFPYFWKHPNIHRTYTKTIEIIPSKVTRRDSRRDFT